MSANSVSAPAAGTYAVEVSTDLQTWDTLKSASATNGIVSFDDLVEALGNKFYRLRLE